METGRHVGRVRATIPLMLQWLGLSRGTILSAKVDHEYGRVELIIEHPGMPLRYEGALTGDVDLPEVIEADRALVLLEKLDE